MSLRVPTTSTIERSSIATDVGGTGDYDWFMVKQGIFCSEEYKYLSVLLLDLCRWIFNMAAKKVPFKYRSNFFFILKSHRLLLKRKTLANSLKLNNWNWKKKLRKKVLKGGSYLVQANNWQRRGKNRSGARFAQSWHRFNTHIKRKVKVKVK